jgi:hypothetical protein
VKVVVEFGLPITAIGPAINGGVTTLAGVPVRTVYGSWLSRV